MLEVSNEWIDSPVSFSSLSDMLNGLAADGFVIEPESLVEPLC
jgi:hypothetical protein